MAVQRISRSFKDISLAFTPHPVTGDIGVIRNERAINRSVRNIIETNLGEKPFDPDFGADIRSQLFELCDYGTASILEDQILTALQNHEPRIDDITASWWNLFQTRTPLKSLLPTILSGKSSQPRLIHSSSRQLGNVVY